MKEWIFPGQALEGQFVSLVPMEKKYFAALAQLALDKRIWQFYPVDFSDPEKFQGSLNAALGEREKGAQFPFCIIDKTSGAIIGSTRFLDIQPLHRKLEIGWTWLRPEYWATVINPECKLLLLTYCFDRLNASRVQLKTDANNIRSRKAIEKIGGQFEGILRNDIIRDNGTKRSSAYFSIIEEEWPEKKLKLAALLNAKIQSSGSR